MAKSEHHKAGIKQDGLWSKGLTLSVWKDARIHHKMGPKQEQYFLLFLFLRNFYQLWTEWEQKRVGRQIRATVLTLLNPSLSILPLAWS